MHLSIGTMDIKTIRYIIRRSNQVRGFRLMVYQVTSDAYSDKVREDLFNDIKNYTAKMDEVKVKFTYNGRVCYLSQGKESLMTKTDDAEIHTGWNHDKTETTMTMN